MLSMTYYAQNYAGIIGLGPTTMELKNEGVSSLKHYCTHAT